MVCPHADVPAEGVLELEEPGRQQRGDREEEAEPGRASPGRARGSRPAEIVAPGAGDARAPARATCTTPIDDRVAQAQVALGRGPGGPTRSANHITRAPADQRRRPTTHSERRSPVMTSLSSRPAMPTGMRADDDVPAHPVVEVAAVLRLDQAQRPGPDDLPDVPGEVDDAPRRCAHLDHGGEAGDRRVADVEAEQLLGDRQVAGARDRAGTRSVPRRCRGSRRRSSSCGTWSG